MTHDVFTDHYRVLSTDAAARARLLADPRAELLRHFGYLPDGDYRLEVVEQRSDTITILLPAPPAEHEDPAARLAEVTGRIYDILFTTGVGGFSRRGTHLVAAGPAVALGRARAGVTAALGQPAASVDTVDGRGYGDIHPGCPSVAGAGQQYVSEMASSNMGDFDHWETSISEAFVALRASTPDPASFRGALVQVGHGELCHLTTVDAAPQDVARSPGLVRRNPTDSVMIGLQTRGRGFVEQDGRVAAVGPGDLVVYDPARPYTLRFPTPFVTRVLLLPRTHLREVEQAIGDLTARALPGAGGIGAVFGAFVTSVAEQRDTLTEDTHQSLCWQAAALGTALLRTVAGTSTPHSPAQEDLLRRARTCSPSARPRRAAGSRPGGWTGRARRSPPIPPSWCRWSRPAAASPTPPTSPARSRAGSDSPPARSPRASPDGEHDRPASSTSTASMAANVGGWSPPRCGGVAANAWRSRRRPASRA
ncbi:AraC-like ligand-binding domain-containing protein [Nocardia farcinica]